MVKKVISNFHKLNNPMLTYMIFTLVILFLIAYFYNQNTNPVKNELSQIQEIAQNYKAQNGNFGILLPSEKKSNCFAGNTFVKVPQMTEVLSGPDVENISCVFKTATDSPVIEAWSITIVKGEKTYCEDSSGDRRETPGLTTREICNLEI
jgi:hypothetical protein